MKKNIYFFFLFISLSVNKRERKDIAISKLRTREKTRANIHRIDRLGLCAGLIVMCCVRNFGTRRKFQDADRPGANISISRGSAMCAPIRERGDISAKRPRGTSTEFHSDRMRTTSSGCERFHPGNNKSKTTAPLGIPRARKNTNFLRYLYSREFPPPHSQEILDSLKTYTESS